jgi:predicted O-methyltransferase YrrM
LKNCKDIIRRIYEIQKRVPRPRYGGFPNPEIFYILVRKIRPKIVVETGVSFGITSSFILQAMEENGFGTLYSIDLPFQFATKEEVGMAVPKRLRHRWNLILGDSKIELPRLLKDVGSIDVFFHDSLHTYEHMMFEFKTAWPKIKKNGYLISDNIDQNNSFIDFCKAIECKPVILSANLGIIVK